MNPPQTVLLATVLVSLWACAESPVPTTQPDAARSADLSVADTSGSADLPLADTTETTDTSVPEDADAPDTGPLTAVCEGAYVGPEVGGVASSGLLSEASGLAASRQNAGVLWTHNDSGDTARVFAIDASARLLATVTLDGVEARDFEDIALGPCPGEDRRCLWVADTGDNDRVRTDATVYVIAEPELTAGALGQTLSAEVLDTFPITYPGGPLDAEGLVVAPDGSTFFLFEKAVGAHARVFAHPKPLESEVQTEMTVLAEIRNPGPITGADLHPLGQRVLVRTYSSILEYRLGATSMGNIAEVAGVEAGAVSEPQGEAIAYDASGLGYWTLSENGFSGENQPLHHWGCSQ